MSKKKKIIVMSSLVLLLALTAVLNVVLARTKTAKGDSAIATSNYFTTYRSERTTTRSEELVQLDSVIALYDANDEKYKEAVNLKIKIVEIMEKELVLETMIKSKELDINTALSIYHCLKDEAGIIPENIIIMPVYSQI